MTDGGGPAARHGPACRDHRGEHAEMLREADRLLPGGGIIGCYAVGSAALGAWLPGRSDIDFIAVVDGDISDRESRRLRVMHAIGNATAAGRAWCGLFQLSQER